MKKIVFAVLILAVVAALVVLPVAAKQNFVMIHHASQGQGDPSWTDCRPEAEWNGHKRHEDDWKGAACNDDPDPTATLGDNNPTATPSDGGITATPGDNNPTATPSDGGITATPGDNITPTPGGGGQVTATPVVPEPTKAPPGCMLDVQLFAEVKDLPANVAYLVIAYSGKAPSDVTQADEGEVASFYVVNNGRLTLIQPNGHQAPFLALTTAGTSVVDGNAYVRACTGSVFINMYDAAGNFLGHPGLRWNDDIAKGFHAENSGYRDELSFLDLGVMPK